MNIYPDGGICTSGVYGQVKINLQDSDQMLDVLALEHGGRVVAYSDAHFGHPRNLINPGRGINMGDGWENQTASCSRFDWCILALGASARIEKLKLIPPILREISLQRFLFKPSMLRMQPMSNSFPQSMFWPFLLAAQPMQMDHIHHYINEILQHEKISHIRVNMIPDGGISRIRLWGKLA